MSECSLHLFFSDAVVAVTVSSFSVGTGSGGAIRGSPTPLSDSYLVDPASSHMLVSKIKPCMSKYKPH